MFKDQSIHHPWFQSPVMKRGLSSTEDDDQPSEPPLLLQRQKRRKYSLLEHGFAHLSLSNALPQVSPSVIPPSHDLSLQPASLGVHDAHAFDVILPSSVEEPTSPVPEVDMDADTDIFNTSTDPHTSPVPTNRDCKDVEDEVQIKNVEISRFVLERLKKQTIIPPAPPFLFTAAPNPSTSQALVLFRPLRPPSPTYLPVEIDDNVTASTSASFVSIEDTAMDVEE
ncbi:hypothetical protein F5I97DRAFT_2005106 [Phlebopus sp. FC_14]|nr:hypothetical protein F5I97DRAFT_2005106 [Phlebopus sp. FC_14]